MPQFQILVLDTGSKTRCATSTDLLYSIRGFGRLWPDHTSVLEKESRIVADAYTIEVSTKEENSEQPADRDLSRAFLVTLEGQIDAIGPLRVPLLEFIRDLSFEHRYVVKDEVSQHIAGELYPYLYRVENLLRGYLTRFMTTRFGGTWWKLNASKEMDDKTKMRRKNDQVFGKLIDNSAYLIDFGELGELVFKQTSGFLTKEDVEKRVMQLPETIDALKSLKAELQTNYHKFFKAAFADKDFQPKWSRWEVLRNKIAHANLFIEEDLTEGKALAEEIIAIITAAEESDAQPIVTRSEREAMQEQVIARTVLDEPAETFAAEPCPNSTIVEVTEQEFLRQLVDQESYYQNKAGGFVGLTRFLRFHLPELGFDETSARRVLKRLQREGKIVVYQVPNPYDSALTTAALRTPARGEEEVQIRPANLGLRQPSA